MDFKHDSTMATMLHIAEKLDNQLPTYVRKCNPMDKSAASLSSQAFADEGARMYPLNTPANTWLSGAYLAYNKGNVKQAAFDYYKDKILVAAQIYGIRDDVEAAMDTLTKKAEVVDGDSNYGYVMPQPDGSVVRLFPMHDEQGVKMACDYFDAYAQRYDKAVRSTVAVNILRKAAEFGIEQIPESVRTEAGYGVFDKVALMHGINNRARMVDDAEQGAALANLNNLIMGLDGETLAGSLQKFAETLEVFDRLNGLNYAYGKRLMPPASLVFAIDPKEAAASTQRAVKLHKGIFDIEKLAEALTQETLQNVLGAVVTHRFLGSDSKVDTQKLASAIAELKPAEKRALEDALRATYG